MDGNLYLERENEVKRFCSFVENILFKINEKSRIEKLWAGILGLNSSCVVEELFKSFSININSSLPLILLDVLFF
jgi:hypothetical protein